MAGHLPPASSPRRWLVTTNHKDVGILYLITSIFTLVFAGVLGLLIRLQLWEPGATVLTELAYNETVTAHGLLMVFWFLSPLGFAFANYVVPLQIGADDLAFPRLNALSYWIYFFSLLLFGVSFFQGGTFDAGWTMYAPLNVPTYTPSIGGNTVVLALGMFVVSTTLSTINFLTTIHHSRAPGLGLWNMPFFTWSILLTVWMMLFAFAALLGASLLLSADRIIGTLYFSAQNEQGSLLWAHLFWFFGHPEVYIVFFPALGIMFEAFQTFTGRRIVGRKWVIVAMILVAAQSFLVWMHHMFLTTINLQIKTIFMATTIGISLPFDLMVFALIYTMVKGRVQFTTPFLFALGALVLFILGGITGVFLGAVVLDYEFRGTFWVVAHFHYVMVAGVTALIGGVYYWFPKMTGRMYDEFLGKAHFATYFLGFNLLYFPMFVVWETPRRVFDYQEGLTLGHQVATVGAFVLAASFLIMFYNFARSYLSGPIASDNPWDFSHTLEWAIPSPPPLENWEGRPSYETGRLEFVRDDHDGAAADGGATTATPERAEPEAVETAEHADHASIWPFGIGVALFTVLLGLSGIRDFATGEDGLVYPAILAVGLLISAYVGIGFGRESFYAPEMPVAERWPFQRVGKTKLGVWFFLASDVVVFGAIIGAFIFIRLGVGWEQWERIPPNEIPGLVNTFVLLTSSFTVVLALVMAERGNRNGLVASLGATILLGLTFLGIKAWEWNMEFAHGVYPQSSLEASTYYVTTGVHALHVILGLLVVSFMIVRAGNGAYLEDERPVEFFGLYWHFVDIVWVFLFPMFYLM